MKEDFYSLQEVAEKLGHNERWVGERVNSGELKAYKIGRRYFFLHSDLVAFIKKHPVVV